jgi:hypothetical protein
MFGRKVKLKWDGAEYTLSTTFELAEEIDSEINILQTALDIDSGGIPKITVVSKLYSVLLRYAGASVGAADIYKSIMANPADSAALINAARVGLNCLFPEVESAERDAGKHSVDAKKKG